jgi:hypothetical protein
MITILSQPSVSLSADHALFVVSGSNFASGNYRYVADVSGTTLLSRLKCDKLPNNQGFFNVARVIETLVPITKPAVTFFQDPLIASTYQVGFREEFGTPPVVATGSTTASGIVFQGYKRQWEDFVSSGYYTSGSTAKILSKQPTKRKIRIGENDFASVLFHIVTGSPSYRVTITAPARTFSVSGSVATDELNGMFNLGLAGIYSLTSGQTSDGQVGSYLMAGISSYTVTIEYVHSGDTQYYSEGRSEQDLENEISIEYEVESCERFVPQRLFFKNSLGGFDGYTFTMKNRKTGNMTKQTFGKNQNIYGTKVAETIYSGQFEETLTLNSDWLLDANWMSELIYSPQVYLQIGSELVEAIVNTSSFTFHTRPQDKLQQLQVEVKIAYKNSVI